MKLESYCDACGNCSRCGECCASLLPITRAEEKRIREYIKDNKCGMACNFDSKEVFDSIKKLVENSDLRNTMSDNAYIDSNKDFAWENVIKKTINEYKKI